MERIGFALLGGGTLRAVSGDLILASANLAALGGSAAAAMAEVTSSNRDSVSASSHDSDASVKVHDAACFSLPERW